jgi:DNA-binding MarR family transcriptional regulator
VADVLNRRLGFLIRLLHQIHLALFAEEREPFGVTPVQFSILSIAAARPGIEQGELAHEIGVDRTTLANVLARLEGSGLVARAIAAADRRVKLVTLTMAGRRTLKRMQAATERAHARTIEALPPEQRAAFLEALGALVAAGNGYGRAPMRLA